MRDLPNLSWISRAIGVGPRFQRTLIDLLDFGYKCRWVWACFVYYGSNLYGFSIRLPLFISAGFVLCHIFSVYLPTVEINVEVIDENRPDDDVDEEEEEDEEYSIGDSDSSDSDLDLAVFVEIVGERPGGEH